MTTQDGKVYVTVKQTGERFSCALGESLLSGMARLGRRGIPVGCLSGGCGVCKVAVCRGSVRKTGAMSHAHISEAEEAQGVVLACRVAPTDDVELEVVGKMQKPFFKGFSFQVAQDSTK
ncbi:2Fe-2S iron-sulfur cluster-binding protein [Burkholderia vietnamiensis]|uniref:2Fe-2S iron-sulfur cluster-binding protein n=1 Tax=Burkholderia vietnamiensis TaxID=60552 RepID=UPI001593A900|nr:2Fe-2S iron-sulfur cluster-binding protein [Burkholderia vietnamiensis]